jgi:hypothetical protein
MSSIASFHTLSLLRTVADTLAPTALFNREETVAAVFNPQELVVVVNRIVHLC